MSERPDRWAAGSAYETFMGRWSRQLAARFVSWLQAPAGVHWLDVGCGTGALTQLVCQEADPASVVGCDPAKAFVEYAREHNQDVRAGFAVAGVGSLPVRSGGYGSLSSLLALNFFPDPDAAMDEMHSLASSGALVSACVWDYAGRMEFLRRFWDVATLLDPEADKLDEGTRFPLCRPEMLLELFRGADLQELRCVGIEIPTTFSDFGEYWRSFLSGTGPAPSYVASLDKDQLKTLAEKLERELPRQPDGTIALTARAWAVRGTAI